MRTSVPSLGRTTAKRSAGRDGTAPTSKSKRARTRLPKRHWTKKGYTLQGTIEDFLSSEEARRLLGKVNLIFTSPPFPLNRKKKYGNRQGDDYIRWLSDLAPKLRALLTKKGSIVLEMGNAWEPGKPIMSILALRALIKFMEDGGLHLCQQFICYNPARLPSPAQWVNVDRIRVKDSYTHVWWLSATDRPKANNRRVLTEYSDAMRRLLKSKKYNPGRRPSEFVIGSESFLKNNKGAIPSNVLTIANTASSDAYLSYCKEKDLPLHPARMPTKLAEFFIKFLTTKNDLVLDPFSGSNTTGAAAQYLGRRWISIEPRPEYIQGSRGRFLKSKVKKEKRG